MILSTKAAGNTDVTCEGDSDICSRDKKVRHIKALLIHRCDTSSAFLHDSIPADIFDPKAVFGIRVPPCVGPSRKNSYWILQSLMPRQKCLCKSRAKYSSSNLP